MAHAIEATAESSIRSLVTRIAAGLIAMLVLVGLGSAPALIAGFTDRSDVHAFHMVEWGTLAGVLFGGSLLIVAVSADHSQAAVRAALAIGVTFLVVAVLARVVGPETLSPLVLATVVALLSGLPLLAGNWRPRSLPLALMSLAALVAGVINAAVEIGFQLDRVDVHSADLHYAGSAVVLLAIPIVAYIVATLPDGYRPVTWLVGSAATLLGLGSLLIQRTGAFAALPAVLMIVWGVAFVAIAHSVHTNAAAAAAGWGESHNA
jgi:hypothetical protein